MYFWDSVGDFLHTSDNERKRDEYSKLVKYLNKKIPKAEELYSNLKTGTDMEFKIMKGTKDKNLVGELVKMYDLKFEVYQTDTTNLLNYYKNMIAAFRNKLASAQSLYEYYAEQCRLEDERRRQRIREEQEREERERAAAQSAKAKK